MKTATRHETTTLRNGLTVLAKRDKYGIGAKTFANLTQANNAAAALQSLDTSCDVRAFGRPFYVVIR